MARKRNYLNNRDLLEQIIQSKEEGELTPKAFEFLMLLADKCSRKLTYRNPEDRQDCIAYAYMDLIDIGEILIQKKVLMHLLTLLK